MFIEPFNFASKVRSDMGYFNSLLNKPQKINNIDIYVKRGMSKLKRKLSCLFIYSVQNFSRLSRRITEALSRAVTRLGISSN